MRYEWAGTNPDQIETGLAWFALLVQLVGDIMPVSRKGINESLAVSTVSSRDVGKELKGMLYRMLTALVGIPLAVVLVFWPGGIPFAVAMGVISVLGAMEFYRGVRKIGARPVEWAGLSAVLFFVFSA